MGVRTIGIGKVEDLFAGSGLDVSRPTTSNADGMVTIARLWAEQRNQPHFIFANLIDFDSLYGHRRDPEGYARALREFDDWLGQFIGHVGPDDLLIVTGDHGNDPYHRGTDHTRERVPLMVLHGEAPAEGHFKDVSALIERHLFPTPPEYFQTVFRAEPPPGGWPDSFAVVTAFNPRRNPQASAEENAHADLELHRELAARGLQPFRVTGASPDLLHQEPGWGFDVADLTTPANSRRVSTSSLSSTSTTGGSSSTRMAPAPVGRWPNGRTAWFDRPGQPRPGDYWPTQATLSR
ncbi:MAG: DUF3293 domain-containing protein [Luteolibacter sp.]